MSEHAVPVAARMWQGQRAGLISRTLANLIDAVAVVTALAAGYAVVVTIRFLWDARTFSFPALPYGLILLVGSLAVTGYFAGAWATAGQTYGDYLLGLRVVDAAGRHLHAGRAMVRAALCVVFPIGLFWVAVSRHNRSVQDIVLRTSVIYDWAGNVRPALKAATDSAHDASAGNGDEAKAGRSADLVSRAGLAQL